MAMYDYTCSSCSQTVEINRKIAERDDPLDCPSCGAKDAMTRQVSSSLIGYSTTVPGSYSRSAGDGWRDVLRKVHSAPGARQTSSLL